MAVGARRQNEICYLSVLFSKCDEYFIWHFYKERSFFLSFRGLELAEKKELYHQYLLYSVTLNVKQRVGFLIKIHRKVMRGGL